jgi:hypothetical protein
MTADLTEQLLREQLHAAAEGQSESYLDVDPLTALDTGHRIQRRRRLTAVAGTAAAALVLGVGGWAVLSQEAPDDRTLPAITATVNGPSVTLPLGSDPASGSTEPLSAVVTVAETSGKVEFRLRTETGSVLKQQVLGAPDGQVTWMILSERIMVALIPAEATGFAPRVGNDVTPLRTAAMTLPDGRIAAAWLTDQPETVNHFAGAVWTDGTTAFSVDGQAMVSTVVDGDIVVFTGTGVENIAVGYIRPEPDSLSGSGEIIRRADLWRPFDTSPSVWVPDRSGEGGVFAVHLPAIDEKVADQVALETAPGATVRDVKLYRPSQVFLLVAHIDGPPDSVVAVTYPGSEDYPPGPRTQWWP